MMDRVLTLWVSSLIELSRTAWVLGRGEPWRPGTKLRLLFAGYNGSRNTGADVRVEEMLRQIRHVLGPENVKLSVLTQNFDLTRGYFTGARQVKLPDIFPTFLYREVPKHHGVIACEGSMFKSKFANALTVMMVGSLGIAAARNGLSVGYGAEAGNMDRYIRRMCRRYCSQSFVITRNPESRDILRKLGVSTDTGTDTAWTFQPHPEDRGREILKGTGWDGKMPILVVCPINPFWWPVKASLLKAAGTLVGAHRESHYRSIYFHNSGPDVDAAYERYIAAFANAIKAFRSRHNVFPLMVAMERLDAAACRDIAARLGGAAVLTSDDHDMYEMVSVLRCCQLMVSSRYHGIVTSMPGLVASAGVTMDERIRNLMHDRGQPELFLAVDDPDLEPRLLDMLETLHSEQDSIREGVGRNVVKNLKTMARMGISFVEHVRSRFPAFPTQDGVRSWEQYLPPLSLELQQLVERYDT